MKISDMSKKKKIAERLNLDAIQADIKSLPIAPSIGELNQDEVLNNLVKERKKTL